MVYYHKADSGPSLQPMASLVKLEGNTSGGKALFTGTCSTCHQVNGTGVSFGPDLSEVGAKYGKEGLYTAVLKPDAGIAHGYDGFVFKTKDGNQVLGYINSETPDELMIVTTGGTPSKIRKAELVSKKPYGHSMMPTGLLNGMKQQQVIDLIEYLSALKKRS